MKVLYEEGYKIVVPSSFESDSIVDAMNTEIPRALFRINTHECFISHLYVPLVLRRRGIGKKLLFEVAFECLKNGCECIKLDDTSDRYRSKKNIYVECGFKYESNSGPEMYTDSLSLIKCLRE